jgi:hypothetical protein
VATTIQAAAAAEESSWDTQTMWNTGDDFHEKVSQSDGK